jgi:DNA-binding transcriptional MocR family regulator
VKGGRGTIHDRLLHALQQDIASGALAPGDRLPTHRELAYRLRIGIGTVTKAYAQAVQRGLLVARVGSGTFVASPEPHGPRASLIGTEDAPLDLARNVPPLGTLTTGLSEALANLRRRRDLMNRLHYAPHQGFESDRKLAAAWLARSAGFEEADFRRLVVCTGGQHAMTLAFDVLCRPGDVIFTESMTFFGVKAIAEHFGYRLVGLPMDAEGMLPDALDSAVSAIGGRVVYIMPTLQNPTARTMSVRRREEIVRVARRHDLSIVEDDIYAPLARQAPLTASGAKAAPELYLLPPLACFAPERTFYVSSVSKVLTPGIRVGFLVVPTIEHLERALQAVRATCYTTGSLGPLIAAQWIEDGTADAAVAAIAREAASRTSLAQRILGSAIDIPAHPSSLHVWLPLSELDTERVAGRALRGGVSVTPPSAPRVEAGDNSGLRLCLGALPNLAVLERALRVVLAAISSEIDDHSRSVL